MEASRPLLLIWPRLVVILPKPVTVGMATLNSKSYVLLLYASRLPAVRPLNSVKSRPIFKPLVRSHFRLSLPNVFTCWPNAVVPPSPKT